MNSDKRKAIFMSKKFFFDELDQFKESGKDIIIFFKQHNIDVFVISKRNTISILNRKVPSELNDDLKFISRSNSNWEEITKLQREGNMFAVIGVVDEDAIFAFQSKIPLFNPTLLGYEVGKKVDDYGLPIASLEDISDCYKAFEIHEKNYFTMIFDDVFTVISLNNANTYYRPEEEVRIKELFKTNLKGDIYTRNHKILLLLLFHLVNEITTNDFYFDVDLWGTFPSSNPLNTSTSVAFLKESVRCIVGGGPRGGAELFIRTRSKPPKHFSGNQKYEDRGTADFQTIIVNPKLYSRIKGKVVCIIDDYITTGYSAEVAKSLLFAAGAKKVIFLSIGKFGKNYYSADYDIQGIVSGYYTTKFNGEIKYNDYYNNQSFYNLDNDSEIMSFSDIL